MASTQTVCPKCGKDVDFDSALVRCYCPGCGRMLIRADLSEKPSAEEACALLSSGEDLIGRKEYAEAFSAWASAVGAASSKDLAVWREKIPGLIASNVTGDLMLLQPEVQDGYVDVCEAFRRKGFDLAGKTVDSAMETPLTGKFNADMTNFFAVISLQGVAIEYAKDTEDMYNKCRSVQDRYYDCRAALKDGEGKTLFAAKSMYNDAIKPFVVLGGLVNSKTRRMTQTKKDALNKLCAETELPPEVRGMVINAVNWQVRRMATTSLKENSKYKSNMKKDLRAFIEGYFGRFNY